MPVDCELRYHPEGLHLADRDSLRGTFTVHTGESIVLFNRTPQRHKDYRLMLADVDEARIYALNPTALFTLLRPDGSFGVNVVDSDLAYDFNQIRMITLREESGPWISHIRDLRGKATGEVFVAKFRK